MHLVGVAVTLTPVAGFPPRLGIDLAPLRRLRSPTAGVFHLFARLSLTLREDCSPDTSNDCASYHEGVPPARLRFQLLHPAKH